MAKSTNQRKRRPLLERVPTSVLAIVCFALILLAGAGGIYLASAGQSAQNEVGAKEEELEVAEEKVETGTQLADANLEFCADPSVIALLQERGYADVCELAIVVQTQAEPGERGKQGERGPGPTMQQIQAAVDQYFREHPLPEGKRPTIGQVTSAVATYLQAHPPEPGRPPTAEEIAAATASYVAANIEDFRGPEGKRGEKGDPPTAEEVRAAVSAYCAEGNRCKGSQGPQGASITGIDIHRDENGICTFYANVENPANGKVTQHRVQINDEVCEPVPPPTTEPTPPSPPTGGG